MVTEGRPTIRRGLPGGDPEYYPLLAVGIPGIRYLLSRPMRTPPAGGLYAPGGPARGWQPVRRAELPPVATAGNGQPGDPVRLRSWMGRACCATAQSQQGVRPGHQGLGIWRV